MYQPMGNVVIKYFTSCKILGGPIKVGLFTVKYGNYFEDVSCSEFCVPHWKKTVKQSVATPPNPRLVPTSQVFPHHCRQPVPHAEMGDVSRSVKYRSSSPRPLAAQHQWRFVQEEAQSVQTEYARAHLDSSDIWLSSVFTIRLRSGVIKSYCKVCRGSYWSVIKGIPWFEQSQPAITRQPCTLGSTEEHDTAL